MSLRFSTAVALLALVTSTGAGATQTRRATPTKTAAPAPSARGTRRATESRPAAAASRPEAAAQDTVRGGSRERAPAGPRRLQDIHIEGEIPVPQVLFITARDQRHFLGFRHHSYLKSSRQLGEATVLPSRIAVIGSQPHDATQENSP
jgi:hypothetical protein